MGKSRAEVQIIVVQPVQSLKPDCVAVLQRLGPDARIESVDSAPACRERCAQGDVDLVVVDDGLGAQCGPLLGALSASGPPVIVLNRDSE